MRSLTIFVLIGVLASLQIGCRDAPPAAAEPSVGSGPIVLITFATLRPGDLEHMPELSRFAADADWSGVAVAPSSSPVVSSVSLLTGVDPWLHGVLAFDDVRPSLGAPTLGEELGALGYFTEAHLPASSGLARYGLLEGFDVVDRSETGRQAVAMLARVDDAPRLLWIHLPAVSFPLRDHRDEHPDLPEPSRARVDLLELFPSSDPSIALDDSLRIATETLWRHELAVADQRLAELFASLESSGWRHRALIAVTALHGVELGEHEQSLYGWNLGRSVLEVPLVVDLPAGARPLAAPAARLVAQQRLSPTLLEAAGGAPSPSHLASLTHADETPILSTLFLRNGVNRFSIVVPEDTESARGTDAVQLVREARFAPPEPSYWPAVRARAGERLALTVSPARLFERLRRAFRQAPPFAGVEGASERLERWTVDGGVEALDDPARLAALSRALEARWARSAPREQTPEDARKRSALEPTTRYTAASEEHQREPSGP